jgi:hypothetical protein
MEKFIEREPVQNRHTLKVEAAKTKKKGESNRQAEPAHKLKRND